MELHSPLRSATQILYNTKIDSCGGNRMMRDMHAQFVSFAAKKLMILSWDATLCLLTVYPEIRIVQSVHSYQTSN